MFKKIITYSYLFLFSIISVYFLSDKILLPYFLYVDEIVVPDVINHNISTAKILFDKKDLDFNIQYTYSENEIDIGKVTYTNPSAGKIVKKGTIIDLKVFGEREKYIVPNLKNKSKSIAFNILRSMGIKIDTVIYDYHDIICTSLNLNTKDTKYDLIMNECNKVSKNIVWKQYPESGNKFLKNDGLTLYVSRGKDAPEMYEIPNLIDLSLNDAIKEINFSGLLLGNIKYIKSNQKNNFNKVIDQYPYGKCRIYDKINLTVEK